MIQITKTQKPSILVTNEQSWTQEYMGYINNQQTAPDNIVSRYRHKDIRSALENETHNKCAYCEAKIKPSSFGDVEHILPKKKYPQNIFNWDNLTLACEVCNRKYKKEHDNPPLIHPYSDNPANHLVPEGPMILPTPNDSKGDTTTTILQLNRDDLILKRAEKIKSLLALVDKWAAETNQAYKAILKTQLEIEAAPSSEFSFIVSEFLKRRGVLP